MPKVPYIPLADGKKWKITTNSSNTFFSAKNLPDKVLPDTITQGDFKTYIYSDIKDKPYNYKDKRIYIADKIKLKTGYYLLFIFTKSSDTDPYFGPYIVIGDTNGEIIERRAANSGEFLLLGQVNATTFNREEFVEIGLATGGGDISISKFASNEYISLTGYHLEYDEPNKYSIFVYQTTEKPQFFRVTQDKLFNGSGEEIGICDSLTFAKFLWGETVDINQPPPMTEAGSVPGPYDPAGPSTSGGGDGSFDNKSDPVDFTELPSLSVINSGFAGLFKPSLSQLNELANYLWNEDIDINQLRKLVANPLDLLISLTIMPVDPPTAGSEEIKVGFWNTHISINKIENQYMAIDFGSVEVKEYYGNALDYSPYTKISIYLPYIGLKQLNTDDVMKKTLALRYNVDLFTGACVAEIKAGESVLYTFTGNIANQIPLNAESFNSFLSGLIQAAASVGVAIASHGTSVATQGAAEAGEATAMAARGAQTASNLASMNAALTSAGAVATSKPDILHSGSMTANNGYLSGKTPYLIYEVPRACIPENYQTFVGYPSNITKVLSEVTGFTVVDSIHLENIPATDSELTEIERLLRGGVIL